MKVRNLLTICGVAAALMLSSGSIYAQNGGGGGGGGFGGGNGGGGGGGFGGGGFRNMDPAQRQQFMLNNIRDQLGITNDTEWSAIQPLVQKVLDTRMAVGFGGRGFGGRGGRGGGQGGGGMFGQQPNPDREALQSAIDSNAPAAQIKALLAKYQASQKAKQAAAVAAQADLRKVLTVQQEAQATLSGLLE